MFKFSKKSYWASGAVISLIAAGVIVKFALAITAFTPANAPVGYVAQDEMTNYNLKSGTETIFRPEYEKEFYSGNLYAYPIDANGNIDAASDRWSGGAKVHIDAQNYDTGRLIATMKDDGTSIPFRWSSLSAAQQASVTTSSILNFLRGDRSNEIPNVGGTLRQRNSALGDIVHSRPFYVADTTNSTIFVGANDGMLHAINTATGDERWAYVPSMLLSKMKTLAANPYVRDYFVDGQINVATILSSDTTPVTKRVLVGTLGGGGKGLYALNITNSAGLTAATEGDVASKVMWEITPTKVNYATPTGAGGATGYANLGYTYSTPTIAKVGGVAAVIIGNGYNNGGDYNAYLYVINATTGQLISAIQAGTTGTAGSPNGLSTPTAVDTDGNGSVDTVYAGDLNGTMWKFNLTAATATALLTTSPAQPISMTPGVAAHPNGGYMVNFATGAMFTPTDAADTAVHYAYGIWDGAPAANAVLLSQTLTERSFGTTRVRTVTSNSATWASGAANHKGWKVALPAGERVVGDGSYVENGRFYFTGYNPTISTLIPSTTTTVYGENWLMELDNLTGGSKNSPFLDLSGDVKLDNNDRVKYTASDTLPVTVPATVVGDPNLTTDGIPVGKFIGIGVLSQPILVQLATLNDTLFNQNPDIIPPSASLPETGVTGGHFDVDVFYGADTLGTGATATITVGTSGQTSGKPATLGSIAVDGVTIMSGLTITDITNGIDNLNNTTTLKNKITGGGYSATKSGNVITVTAPPGISYNGKTFTITAGSTGSPTAAIPAVRPTAFITFGGGTTSGSTSAVINDTLSGSTSIKVGSTTASSNDITIGRSKTPANAASAVVSVIGTGGTIKAYVGGNGVTSLCASKTSNVVCLVDTSTYGNGNSVSVGSTTNFNTLTMATTASAGGNAGAAATPGWTNFAPALTTVAFSGGTAPTVGDTCTNCDTKSHTHQYDDKFDVTGVDMLNPSLNALNISNGIPSTSTNFKVLMQNQYLSPGLKLHIGDASYLFNVDLGYVSVKNYLTSATLDVATLPTYNRSTIGSLAINMPLDALTSKDWWGNGDVRTGLHPAGNYLCPIKSKTTSNDGNMFRPIIPPANGVEGPGTAGWSASTTPATATGARHNGALTVQLISASTPNSAIEQNVAGFPEYGWRVKSAHYATYVLMEYVFFWHTPHPVTHISNTGPCYGDAGWTKQPALDPTSSALSAKAAGSTDPHIGDLSAGSGGTATSTTTTTVGNVTTTLIAYNNGTTASIVRTTNADGTVTIVTTDAASNITTDIVAAVTGSIKRGGDERGLQARTGRISWRELIKP